MHGRMHPNYGLATILLAHDPLSPSAYPVITHTHPVAGLKLWLLAYSQQSILCVHKVWCAHTCTCILWCVCVCVCGFIHFPSDANVP